MRSGYDPQGRKLTAQELESHRAKLEQLERREAFLEAQRNAIVTATARATGHATGVVASELQSQMMKGLFDVDTTPDGKPVPSYAEARRRDIVALLPRFRHDYAGGLSSGSSLHVTFDHDAGGVSFIETAELNRAGPGRVASYFLTTERYGQRLNCHGSLIYRGVSVASNSSPIVFQFQTDPIRDVTVPRECAGLVPREVSTAFVGEDLAVLRNAEEVGRLSRTGGVTIGGIHSAPRP